MDWKANLLLVLAGSWKGLRSDVIAPLARRIGTAFAVWIVATVGADPSLAGEVEALIVAGCLIAFDLLASHFSRVGREGK